MVSTNPRSGRRRKYDNSRRRADAEARQRKIIEAATDLFIEQGFGATLIDQIAAQADVSAPTVYATFGSKASVLARAIDAALVGDFDEVPVVDRIRRVIDDSGSDPRGQLVAVAYFIRTVNERVAPLIRVMEQACSTDPALQEVRAKLIDAIRLDSEKMIKKYWQGALRPGLSVDEAAAALAMMMSPQVYSMLSVDMGWSPDRYQQWMVHALPHLFLRPELLADSRSAPTS
jgi:AcrR family transcriptional regulator